MTEKTQDQEIEAVEVPALNGAESGEIETKRRMRNSDDNKATGPILDLMHGNLTQAFVEEMQNLEKPWAKLSEAQMRDAIDRCKDRAEHHIRTIANAIGSRGHERCEALIEQVTVKDGYRVVLKVAGDENGISCVRRQGHNIVVVFADEDDFINGGTFPEPMKDQPGFFDDNAAKVVDDDSDQAADSGDIDQLYDQAVDFVVTEGKVSIDAVQRELRVGYNRAARLVETMEVNEIVSPVDQHGQRLVLGLEDGEAVDTETGEISELGTESMDQFEVTNQVEGTEIVEDLIDEQGAEAAEVEAPKSRTGNYELRVNGVLEAPIDADSIEQAVEALGYTEYEIQNPGTDDECATIRDDERIEDEQATVEVVYSENQ